MFKDKKIRGLLLIMILAMLFLTAVTAPMNMNNNTSAAPVSSVLSCIMDYDESGIPQTLYEPPLNNAAVNWGHTQQASTSQP
jgi:hypothetical protein